MANKNLFYKLYSTNNSLVDSGYTCNSAVDETATSFDIASSSGEITDSNGDTLSSIDLSEIHAEGLTQYNTETRILQPYSCCLLQGQEYGLAKATYYYIVPERIVETKEYEYYLNCDFDVIFNTFNSNILHISVNADGTEIFSEKVNDALDKQNIKVTASLQTLEDPKDKSQVTYLVFASQEEGYFYYISNLKVSPIFQSKKYPTSPFSNEVDNVKTIIYNLLEKYHPLKKGQEYDEDTYEIDCKLYQWLLTNYVSIIEYQGYFEKMLEVLANIKPDDDINEKIDDANAYIKDTVYDNDDVFGNYDITNMYVILDVIKELTKKINSYKHFYLTQYWLHEDCRRRIPLMKYPNGAFRGIVVVPDFPDDDDYEYSSLWIHHVKDTVKLYSQVLDGHYMPKKYGVLSNATLAYERKDTINIQSNLQLLTALDGGWEATNNVNYVSHDQPDDPVYMGGGRYMDKNNVIGLFRYIQYVNDEDLWNKVGDGYIIVGKDDDPQNFTRNLPTSLLIYNPNSIPVRIKYMIFS